MTGILFNPYDFANPVSNMDVFADRIRERDEISLSEESQKLSAELLNEIHELSSGRPYEVQLLCHAMFKGMSRARRGARCLVRPVISTGGAPSLTEEMGQLDVWQYAKEAKRLLTAH